VKWRDTLSKSFAIDSSVRQDDIRSSWLFNLFVNKLILRLENSNNESTVNNVFAGCICYADDILLLSGSWLKLQMMLDLCAEFGCDVGFHFNGKTS
jgi:hypothetical protein